MRGLSVMPPAEERPIVARTAEEEKRKKPGQSNFCSRTAFRSGISFQVAHRPAMPTGQKKQIKSSYKIDDSKCRQTLRMASRSV